MTSRTTTNILLVLVALFLAGLLLRPLPALRPVHAESSSAYPLAFEPGVFLLRAPDASRQVFGKVAIDLRTGTVWGFPTNTQDPYPTNPIDSKPVISHPFILARYAVEDTAVR